MNTVALTSAGPTYYRRRPLNLWDAMDWLVADPQEVEAFVTPRPPTAGEAFCTNLYHVRAQWRGYVQAGRDLQAYTRFRLEDGLLQVARLIHTAARPRYHI